MIERRSTLARTPERELAISCLEAGLTAGDPERISAAAIEVTGENLVVRGDTYDLSSYESVIVVGGGKCGARQALAMESLLGDVIDDGLVVSTEVCPSDRIEIVRGDHPVPTDRSVRATRQILDIVEAAGSETLVIVLVSGGGSALLTAPTNGVSLADVRGVTEALLTSGASIHEINAVRKHLSALKGGQLARAASPATVLGLVISDVVGDDPSVIASGPTVPDPTTFEDARSVLARYDIDVPSNVATVLERGATGDRAETPGPEDAVFERVSTVLIADSATALRAATAYVRTQGLTPMVLSSRMRGESHEIAKAHVAIGEEVHHTGEPVAPPAVLLSAGETTVTVRGDGSGGPNLEFALGAALELTEGMTVAAIDTDGIDGKSPAAGGLVDDTTVDDPEFARETLAINDAHPYLDARDDVIVTGPTGTNLNDLRVVVVGDLE